MCAKVEMKEMGGRGLILTPVEGSLLPSGLGRMGSEL